jgi:hypothetical protein
LYFRLLKLEDYFNVKPPLKQPPRHAPQVLAEAVAAQDVNVVEEAQNKAARAFEAVDVGAEEEGVGVVGGMHARGAGCTSTS